MAASKKVQLALIAAGAAVLTGAVVVFGLPSREEAPGPAPVPSAETRPAPAASARAPVATPTPVPAPQPAGDGAGEVAGDAPAPAFDIVRVGPQGDSVIAGRAAPGSTLELLVDGKVHDSVPVRESGAFALTPPPLPAGDHEITLRAVGPDGAGTASRQSVTVALAPDRTSAPVVALTEPDKPTALLSGAGVVARELNGTAEAEIIADLAPADVAPAPTAPAPSVAGSAAPAAPAPEKVVVATVEAEAGRLYVSGQAPPESAVRLYLNDTFLAEGKASDGGAVSFRVDSGIPEGDYHVRLDQVTPGDGKVLSRAEVGFAMPETSLSEASLSGTSPAAGPRPGEEGAADDGSHVVVPEVRAVRVERGDSLWRISRRIYGQGLRYTVIYDANQEQIRNPDRIYPGQLFVLPGNAAGNSR